MTDRPQVTVIGGGSAQWVPILVEDFANTSCLNDMTLVLEDLDPSRLEQTGAHARHVAARRRLGWDVVTTTDEATALDGSHYVVVCISTGGFDSMAIDLDVARRHGLPMPIGDTVGPAGISRALRNIPVMVNIARRMESCCPSAWLLNVTNPMTTLCRAITRETAVPTVGLCHEVVNARFFISQLLDCGFFDVDLTVVGVNHLPLITRVCVDGYDRMKDLFELASGGGDRDTPLPFLDRVMADPPIGTGGRPRPRRDGGSGWTKGGVIEHQAVNYEVLREHGALPGADSDHTCEFFPNFITEASGWGRQWGVHMVTIDERRRRETAYRKALGRRLGNHAIPSYRSPEMVAPVIESLLGAESCVLPLNIPNAGQCPQLPDRAVVESMCVVDRDGIRGRDRALAPSTLAKFAARVAASQELTVEAALSGDPELVLEALRTDPFSSRLDHHALNAVRDDILTSTRPWLALF